jgi:hypothetical protein
MADKQISQPDALIEPGRGQIQRYNNKSRAWDHRTRGGINNGVK